MTNNPGGTNTGTGTNTSTNIGNINKSMAVPEAKAAMNQFKTEVASELGVNLKQGYNGDLTSREAGSIGGYMVKKMIHQQEQDMGSSQF